MWIPTILASVFYGYYWIDKILLISIQLPVGPCHMDEKEGTKFNFLFHHIAHHMGHYKYSCKS